MNSYPFNNVAQNQRALFSNYIQGPDINQFQDSIYNFFQIIPYYSPYSMNPNESGYNLVNMIPPQINPTYQQNVILVTPSNQNIIQPQYSQNIIYNQSAMINTYSSYTGYNEIPMQNQIQPFTPVINPNTIQGKSNQVPPFNKPNYFIERIIQINLGNNLNDRKNESMNGHRPIPLKLAFEAMKSICKISYQYNNKPCFGTGFFMNYSDSLKLLITNYHVIHPELININIEIEIWNNEKMILNLKGRYIKFLKKPKDITAIEIKNTDKIYKDIQFLNYDYNYKPFGYDIYKDVYIFSIGHPLGQDVAAASGQIIKKSNYEFDHDISTDVGASGSPIILLNLMMVIGIHKNKKNEKVNRGTFIGEIINEINNDSSLKNK